MTSNPGGHDFPGDYSPDGKRILFDREAPDGSEGLYTVLVNGGGLRKITDAAHRSAAWSMVAAGRSDSVRGPRGRRTATIDLGRQLERHRVAAGADPVVRWCVLGPNVERMPRTRLVA